MLFVADEKWGTASTLWLWCSQQSILFYVFLSLVNTVLLEHSISTRKYTPFSTLMWFFHFLTWLCQLQYTWQLYWRWKGKQKRVDISLQKDKSKEENLEKNRNLGDNLQNSISSHCYVSKVVKEKIIWMQNVIGLWLSYQNV